MPPMDAPAADFSASRELLRANQAFYRAFERLDLDAMREIWLDDDCIQCVHPASEILCGRGAVLGSWRRIFESTHSIHFELRELKATIAPPLGWVVGIERIRSSIGGAAQASEAASTNLYLRRADAWRMVLHHASPITRQIGAAWD